MFWNTCTLAVAVLLTVTVCAFTPEIKLVGRNQNSVTLECRIQLADGDYSRISGATFWLGDRKLTDIIPGAEYSSNADSSRITFSLEQRLEGEYSCMNGTLPSSTINLFSRPIRSTVDRYHAVAINQQVSLECGVLLGYLESYYTPKWLKDADTQVDVSAGTGYKLRRERLEDLTLTILSPSLMDNGTYNCRVSIGTTPTETYVVPEMVAELLVFEKPAIAYMTGMTHDVIAVINNTASTVAFTCNVTGWPNLQISWYHKNKKIKENDKYLVSTEELSEDSKAFRRSQSSALVIRSPLLVDSGSISCEAKISYRDDDGTRSNVINTLTQNITSNLIVLDNKLLVTAIVTNDSDLLIQVYLRNVLPRPLKLSLQFISEDGEIRVFQPESTYSAVDTLYHFVPQTKIPNRYRRFFLQVALVVDQSQGPYNTPESNTIIDLDHPVVCRSERKCDFPTLAVIIAAASAVVALIFIILIISIAYLINRRMKLQSRCNLGANDNEHDIQKFNCEMDTKVRIAKLKLVEDMLLCYGGLNSSARSDEERSNIQMVLETLCSLLNKAIGSDSGDDTPNTTKNAQPTPVTLEKFQEFIDKKQEKIKQLKDQLNKILSTQESAGSTRRRSSKSRCSLQEEDPDAQNHQTSTF